MFEVETTTFCAGTSSALVLPHALWFAVSGVQFYSGDISLAWMGALYSSQVFLNHVLKLLIDRPFSKCRDGLEFPSLDAQLVFSALALVFAVDWLKKSRIGWRRGATLVFIGVYVPLALAVSGDTSVGALAAGAGIGVAFTLLALTVFGLYLEPAWRRAKAWRVIDAMGYKDRICNDLFVGLFDRYPPA